MGQLSTGEKLAQTDSSRLQSPLSLWKIFSVLCLRKISLSSLPLEDLSPIFLRRMCSPTLFFQCCQIKSQQCCHIWRNSTDSFREICSKDQNYCICMHIKMHGRIIYYFAQCICAWKTTWKSLFQYFSLNMLLCPYKSSHCVCYVDSHSQGNGHLCTPCRRRRESPS